MPAVSPRIAWQIVDGEAVLLDLEKGGALGLNATGSFIWKRLAEGASAQLAQDVAAEFEVDLETARRDVETFLATLQTRGFIQ